MAASRSSVAERTVSALRDRPVHVRPTSRPFRLPSARQTRLLSPASSRSEWVARPSGRSLRSCVTARASEPRGREYLLGPVDPRSWSSPPAASTPFVYGLRERYVSVHRSAEKLTRSPATWTYRSSSTTPTETRPVTLSTGSGSTLWWSTGPSSNFTSPRSPRSSSIETKGIRSSRTWSPARRVSDDEVPSVQRELARARRAHGAETAHDTGVPDTAVADRLYYAVFHAVPVVLHDRGYDPNHTGISRYSTRSSLSTVRPHATEAASRPPPRTSEASGLRIRGTQRERRRASRRDAGVRLRDGGSSYNRRARSVEGQVAIGPYRPRTVALRRGPLSGNGKDVNVR